MKILIIDNGTSYLEKLRELFAGHTVTTSSWNTSDRWNQEAADLVVLSGGHRYPVVGHEAEFKDEIEFVKSSSVSVLGICLGFEIIARAFGTMPKLLKRREKGILKISQVAPDPIFEGIDKEILVYESHRWAITAAPQGFTSLATSRDGIEIIKHAKRCIYGFQFHPEMLVEKTEGQKLFKNFLKVLKGK